MSKCEPGCPCGKKPAHNGHHGKSILIIDEASDLDFLDRSPLDEFAEKLEAAEGRKAISRKRDRRVARLQRLRDKRRRPLRPGETG